MLDSDSELKAGCPTVWALSVIRCLPEDWRMTHRGNKRIGKRCVPLCGLRSRRRHRPESRAMPAAGNCHRAGPAPLPRGLEEIRVAWSHHARTATPPTGPVAPSRAVPWPPGRRQAEDGATGSTPASICSSIHARRGQSFAEYPASNHNCLP